MPLLPKGSKSYTLKSKEHEKVEVKLSVTRDGRATLTKGWKALAEKGNINAGALVAFSVGELNCEIDMQMVVLYKGEVNASQGDQ